MTTVEQPGSRARRGAADDAPDEITIVKEVPDWVRRQRRQEARLRRTVLLALLILIAGAVLARWREDPGTVLASGLRPVSGVMASPGQDAAEAGGLDPPA